MFFPYAINLTKLLVKGEPTNPLLKDFLKQFPNKPDEKDINEQNTSQKLYQLNEYEDLGAQIAEDEDIARIEEKIETDRDNKLDSLYASYSPFPRRKTAPKQSKMYKTLEKEKAEKEKIRRERYEKRQEQLKKPVKKDELQEAEKEHQKFIQKIHQPTYAEQFIAPPPQVDQKDEAAKRTEKRKKYGESISKKNKYGIVPKQKQEIEKEEKLPPFATDLNDWEKRVNNEFRELHSLQEQIEDMPLEPLNVNVLIERIQDEENAASAIPDYHLRFALLFKKLENVEERIKNIDEADLNKSIPIM